MFRTRTIITLLAILILAVVVVWGILVITNLQTPLNVVEPKSSQESDKQFTAIAPPFIPQRDERTEFRKRPTQWIQEGDIWEKTDGVNVGSVGSVVFSSSGDVIATGKVVSVDVRNNMIIVEFADGCQTQIIGDYALICGTYSFTVGGVWMYSFTWDKNTQPDSGWTATLADSEPGDIVTVWTKRDAFTKSASVSVSASIGLYQ